MKILFLEPSLAIKGPLPKITIPTVNAMMQAGCQVSTETWGAHKDEESYFKKITGRIQDIVLIRRRLKAEQFDLIFISTAHDWKGITRDISLLWATKNHRPKTVLFYHGSYSHLLVRPGNWLIKFASRIILNMSDAIFLLSTEEQAAWRKFYSRGEYYVVVYPFEPPNDKPSNSNLSHLNLPEGIPLLLYSGRLMPQKGIFDLLDAMACLTKKVHCHLLVAGDGSHMSQVKERITTLGLENHVTLAGYLKGSDLVSAYQIADIFVLPTRGPKEGFPTVISEAMNAGLPVVTTNIRGAADLLQEGVNARFVPPCNPSALGEVLEQLLLDPQQRSNMSQNNKAKVKDFAPEVVIKRYIEIFQELVGKG